MLTTRPKTVKTGKNRYDILVFNEIRNQSQEILLNSAKCCPFFGEIAENARNIRKTLEYIYIYIIGCADVRFLPKTHIFYYIGGQHYAYYS